jgi:hypothetical protein
MNRCTFFVRLALPALALCMALTGHAQAQQARSFPEKALRGNFTVVQPPNILINGEAAQLSPGARIHDEHNRLVLSSHLVGSTHVVNYTREMNDLVHEVWILTATEAKEKRPGMEAKVNFTFASDADKPNVDAGKTPFNQLPRYKK